MRLPHLHKPRLAPHLFSLIVDGFVIHEILHVWWLGVIVVAIGAAFILGDELMP